jgi:hypothetical protein
MHDMHPWHFFVSTTRYPSEAGSAARASSIQMISVNSSPIPAPIATALLSLMNSRRETVGSFFLGVLSMLPTLRCLPAEASISWKRESRWIAFRARPQQKFEPRFVEKRRIAACI